MNYPFHIRFAKFIVARFPPWIYIPSGILTFLAFYLYLTVLIDSPIIFNHYTFIGLTSVILFMFLLRIFDELKDIEVDLRLGRAGDPRYVDRPIVKGEIKESDFHLLKWITTILLITLNLVFISEVTFIVFCVTLLFWWWSYIWFFYPAMKDNLIIAFITHNPLTVLLELYCVSVFYAVYGQLPDWPWVVLILLGIWMPLAAWETSRKIRAPQDETDFQSYSKMLGWKIAISVPAVFILISLACYTTMSLSLGLSWYFLGIICLAGLVFFYRCFLFRLQPNKAHSVLLPYVESYILVTNLGFTITLLIHITTYTLWV